MTLWAEGDVLRYRGPREALTADLLDRFKADKAAILSALAHPDPLPPFAPAAEARRQQLLAILARDRGQYAILVEDPNTDPVVMTLATPDGTCEVLIPRDRYDPFAMLELVAGGEREDADQGLAKPRAHERNRGRGF